MPALLFGIGAFALFAGLVMVGFGIPINEFSFGNTLISAGTTAAVGGLIIIALGIVAGQVRRVAEALAGQLPRGLGSRQTLSIMQAPRAQSRLRDTYRSRPDLGPTRTQLVSRMPFLLLLPLCRSLTSRLNLPPHCATRISHP